MQIRFLSAFLRLLAITSLSLAAGIAQAQIPPTIHYQGYLTSNTGQPVNAPVNVTFRLYAAASGGSPVWTETQNGIGVANGIFNAVLGSTTALNVPFNTPYFLSLQVNTDAEMATRQPLSASPYALRAAQADTVAAGAAIPATQITGTLASSQFAATQLLPTTACAANQFSQWNGAAWVCAAGTGTSATSDVTGNLTMVSSTASAGNILKGGTRFIHNFGASNTFVGLYAGNFTMNALSNTAIGEETLPMNDSGSSNVALGHRALAVNRTGNGNVAIGMEAMSANIIGSDNIVLGWAAGKFTNRDMNIVIGNDGVAGESGTIRIGRPGHNKTFISGIRFNAIEVGNSVPVLIDGFGQLGTASSSRRFKDNIADMDAASSALMNLRPVTFHYKADQNPAGRALQYGLIAEEVNEVYPGLVAHSADGQIETVMYQHLPPMLLNEVQKQQRTIAVQAAELAQQRARIATLEAQAARMEMLERELIAIRRRLALD